MKFKREFSWLSMAEHYTYNTNFLITYNKITKNNIGRYGFIWLQDQIENYNEEKNEE